MKGRAVCSKAILVLLFLYSTILWGQYVKIDESPFHELYSKKEGRVREYHYSKALAASIADFQVSLGVYPKDKVKIYVIYDEEDYRKLSYGKEEIITKSDAFYSAKDEAIYIKAMSLIEENYLNVLIHEYVHWYLDELLVQAPLWFHEGMATLYGRQLGYERYLLYLKESFLKKDADLFRMSYSYPKNSRDWTGFYLSSAMAIKYMQTKYPKAWQSFWEMVAKEHKQGNKANFNRIFAESYRLPMWDFHQKYKAYSQRQGYLYIAVGINTLLFAFLPFVLLIAAKKRKKKMLALPDIEPEEERKVEDEEMGKDGVAEEHKMV